MIKRFGKSSKRKAKIPNLINIALSEAQSLLSSLGINYTTSTTSTSDQNQNNKIVSQSAAENETKLVGDNIELNYYSFGFTPFGFTPFGFTPFSFTPPPDIFTTYHCLSWQAVDGQCSYAGECISYGFGSRC